MKDICLWIIILAPAFRLVNGISKVIYTDVKDKSVDIIASIIIVALTYLVYYLAGLFELV